MKKKQVKKEPDVTISLHLVLSGNNEKVKLQGNGLQFFCKIPNKYRYTLKVGQIAVIQWVNGIGSIIDHGVLGSEKLEKYK